MFCSFRLFLGYFVLLQTSTNEYMMVSDEKVDWSEAHKMCTSRMAGKTVLENCQPETCDPYVMKGLIKNFGDSDFTDHTMWLDGYILRSPIMEYYGCYIISSFDKVEDILGYKNITDNDVLQCTRFCRSVGKSNPGDFILLSKNECYCVTKDRKKLFDQWEESQFKRNITAMCNLTCPGDQDDLCGGLRELQQGYIFSVYIFKPDKLDADIHELGQYCYVLEPDVPSDDLNNRPVNQMSCKDKVYVKCMHEEEPFQDVLVWINKCYDLQLTWYEARRRCQSDMSHLQRSQFYMYCTSKFKEVNSNRVWHNKFIKEKINWNTVQKPSDSSCLALRVTYNGKYSLITVDCEDKFPVLCENIIDATVSNTTNPTPPGNPDHIPLFAIIAVVAVAVIVTGILAMYMVKKFRGKVEKNVSVRASEPYIPDAAEYELVNYSEMNQDTTLTSNDRSQKPASINQSDNLNPTVACIDNDRHGSSNNDLEEYLNPYQPLTANRESDSHLYASTNINTNGLPTNVVFDNAVEEQKTDPHYYMTVLE